MKHRTFAVIFALAIYLASQMAGSLHAAAYGPGEHKHHGHACDIHLTTDQAKLSLPPAPSVICVLTSSGIAIVPPVSSVWLSEECPPGFPRAPPALLLV